MPQCKGYSPCKILSLGQKIKLPKTCEKGLYKHITLVLCKKQVIFEKWEHFENGQKWTQCKGYNPCKILRMGQKIKLAKTCEKCLWKHSRVVLCKKRLEKQLIFEKWEHFENGQKWPQCKGYSPCKIHSLGQKMKVPKTCGRRFYKHITVVLCKKRLEKTANIRKMRAIWKWPQYKGYSPCKILCLKKWNYLRHAKNVSTSTLQVFYVNKRLQKTANNRNMRAFWKWPKMATMQRLPMQNTQFGWKNKIS